MNIVLIVKGQSNAIGVHYNAYEQVTLDNMYGNYANTSNPNGRYCNLNGAPDGKYTSGVHRNIKVWSNQYPYGIDAIKTYKTGTTPWDQVTQTFEDYEPLNSNVCATSNPSSFRYSWWLPFAIRLRDYFGATVYVVNLAVGGISFVDTGNPLRQQYDPAVSNDFYDFGVAQLGLVKTWLTNNSIAIDHYLDLTDQGESDQVSDKATFKANHLSVKSGFKTAIGATTLTTICRQIFQASTNSYNGLSELGSENADWHTIDYLNYQNKYNILSPIPIEPKDGIHIMRVGHDWIGENLANYFIDNIYPGL